MSAGLLRYFLLSFLLLLNACANQPVLSSGLGAMRTSVNHVRTGTDEAFIDINASRRDFAIETVLDENRAPGEKDFAALIDRETRQQWRAAYDSLDGYLAALQDLVDTGRSEQTHANLTSVGEALQGASIGVRLPTGSGEAFAAFGRTLVQAAAERRALKTLRRTDPAFRSLMRTLGDLVAGPDEGTLRAITLTQWHHRLKNIAADDYAAAGPSRDRRAAVIRAYAQTMDARDAKLQMLDELRDCLLALGEAHSAAAKGGEGALLYWVGQIEARLKDVRAAAEKEEA